MHLQHTAQDVQYGIELVAVQPAVVHHMGLVAPGRLGRVGLGRVLAPRGES